MRAPTAARVAHLARRAWPAPALLAALLLTLQSCGCPGRRAAPSRPANVLILVVDTLRYGATGLASRSGATPFLESLAARGVEFTSAYSTFDTTMPSHFSLLTGYVRGQYTALDRAEYSLPFQLRRAGYSTVGVSANGNLSAKRMPTFGGFDRFLNLYDRWLGMTDAERAPLLPDLDARIGPWGGGKNKPNRGAVYCSAERVGRNLVRFIREEARSGKPFFAFANFMEPHDPYYPDPAVVQGDECRRDLPPGFEADVRFRTLPDFLSRPELIRDPARRKDVERRIAASQRPWALADDLTAGELAVYRCRYDAEVREIDRDLARLFAELEERRLLESTIVVITSDHGEAFGEAGFITHQLGGAGDLEATQRVPLIVLLPKRFGARAARIAEPVTIADVAPTLYDLLGFDRQPLFSASTIGNFGRSLARELGVMPPPPRQAVSLPEGAAWGGEPQAQPPDEVVERLRELGYVQ